MAAVHDRHFQEHSKDSHGGISSLMLFGCTAPTFLHDFAKKILGFFCGFASGANSQCVQIVKPRGLLIDEGSL